MAELDHLPEVVRFSRVSVGVRCGRLLPRPVFKRAAHRQRARRRSRAVRGRVDSVADSCRSDIPLCDVLCDVVLESERTGLGRREERTSPLFVRGGDNDPDHSQSVECQPVRVSQRLAV